MAAAKTRSGATGKKPPKPSRSFTSKKMKIRYYILAIITALLAGACTDNIVQEPADVDFCVRAAWQNGLDGSTTRALSATDILASGTEDIVIRTDDYPATINVSCSDGTDFTLAKGAALCADHNEYWQYTPSVIYKDKKIERDDLTFNFTATIDGGDDLVGEADKDAISAKTASAQRHMLVTLHHTKALLRFAFKVDPKYDKVRYIRVTGIRLNDADCELVDKVLTTDGQFIAYAYIDPTVVTTAYENTIQCTYNIYDKDAVFPTPTMTEVEKTTAETELLKHLTREDVVAQNKFTLGSLKKADGVTPVSTIESGYYYDLRVTLNPDYLYVLSEHDNKHITIE